MDLTDFYTYLNSAKSKKDLAVWRSGSNPDEHLFESKGVDNMTKKVDVQTAIIFQNALGHALGLLKHNSGTKLIKVDVLLEVAEKIATGAIEFAEK